jgi:hypothetical protein
VCSLRGTKFISCTSQVNHETFKRGDIKHAVLNICEAGDKNKALARQHGNEVAESLIYQDKGRQTLLNTGGTQGKDKRLCWWQKEGELKVSPDTTAEDTHPDDAAQHPVTSSKTAYTVDFFLNNGKARPTPKTTPEFCQCSISFHLFLALVTIYS